MNVDPLSQLAEAAGVVLDWEDAQGELRRVVPDHVRNILVALGHACDTDGDCRDSLSQMADASPPPMLVIDAGAPFHTKVFGGLARLTLESGERLEVRAGEGGELPAIVEPGYHTLEFDKGVLTVAVCPRRCITPRERLGRRAWGVTAQIYSLAGATGFGDFGDLARFADEAGRAGADALAISPVHALFAADSHHYGPYSPSSRSHLNGLFADPVLLGAPPAAAVDAPLIDWPTVWPAKLDALRAPLEGAREDARFTAFMGEGGEDLRRHAIFEALHGHFLRSQGLGDWRRWPSEFRQAQTAERAAAALGLQDEIMFHLGLQWLADFGLGQAHAAALSAGMGVGLITDLAVGLDPAGSHAWARPEDLLARLTLGAPPDAFQADGQSWGITSFSPEALRRKGFAPFLETLRFALRHAGGVRIDHALGLRRLWVLPEGASPQEGAYLKLPLADLLRLIALESQRSGAIVIGEDLGVVPPGLRDDLETRGILGMRVLPFERTKDGMFRSPAAYDEHAVAMTSTHDLPPAAGWWTERDMVWRARIAGRAIAPEEDAQRAKDRSALWMALTQAGAAGGPQPLVDEPAVVVDAIVAFSAATPCELLLVPVEDLLGLEEPVNLPGTIDQHPNWRRRLPLTAADLFQEPTVCQRLELLNAERPQ